MSEEASKEPLFALDRLADAARDLHQGVQAQSHEIGERVHFDVGPDVLHGVEFGSVGWQVVDMDIGLATKVLLDPGCAMGEEAIPDDDHRPSQLPFQFLDEVANRPRRDVPIGVESEAQANPVSLGRHTQGGDHRDFLMVTAAVVQDRSLAGRSPGSANQGSQENAGFVDEREVRPQPRGFFLMRGHSCLTHDWMRASSRSVARR